MVAATMAGLPNDEVRSNGRHRCAYIDLSQPGRTIDVEQLEQLHVDEIVCVFEPRAHAPSEEEAKEIAEKLQFECVRDTQLLGFEVFTP